MGENRALEEENRGLIEQIEEEKAALKEMELAYKRDSQAEYRLRLAQLQGKDIITKMDIEELVKLKMKTTTMDMTATAEDLETYIGNMVSQALKDKDIEDLIEKQRLIEQGIEAAPQTILPSDILQPRDKITNKVLLGDIPYTGEEVLVGTETQGKNEMTVIVSLKVEGSELRFTKGLSHYDIAIQGAIGRLYMEGNRLVSYTTLYRVLTGNTKARPTKSNIRQLEESLLKSMSTLVYVDCSEEARRYPNLQGFLPKWRSAAELQLGQMVNYNNKVEEDWIKILDTPILFEYACRKKHISQIAMEVLDTPVNKNMDTVSLQYYIQERIIRMRGTKLSKNIAMNRILDQVDYSNCSSKQAVKNKRNRATNNVIKILDHFKDTDFINDYKINMNKLDKKQYQSITIIF